MDVENVQDCVQCANHLQLGAGFKGVGIYGCGECTGLCTVCKSLATECVCFKGVCIFIDAGQCTGLWTVYRSLFNKCWRS